MRATMILLSMVLATQTLAQDHGGHGSAATVDLPAICLENADGHAAPAAQAMGGDAAHRDLMAGMDKMNAEMMAGGTASDLDVAFVCSMIPHHRGAIDMARAELSHGDDPWARGLAEQMIAAQEKEIAEMLAWLGKQ